MPWERPASVPVGQVWSRFKGRERNGQPARMYQIRDMEEKYRDKCLDLMEETFLRDEPLCIALNINNDPESIATIRSNWERLASYQVSLACFTEEDGEPDELVGFNILYVRSQDDEEEDIEKVKGEGWRKLFRTLTATEDLVDVFSHYQVTEYLSDSGLTIDSKHRGQNLGAKLLDAREPMCRALGLDAVSTVFTAATSQALAKKCGYELLGVLPYKNMLQYDIDLSGCENSFAELRGKKFDFNKE